jgi:hypothetical protein
LQAKPSERQKQISAGAGSVCNVQLSQGLSNLAPVF